MGSERSTAGLTGPRFLNLCLHLPQYAGAVAATAHREIRESEQQPQSIASLRLNPDIEVG